jgi:hypothetical protein
MLLLAGLVALQAAGQPAIPGTLAQGTDSAIEEPREAVARTLDEWRELWSAHSAQPIPDVDFSRFVVVGVFLGFRPTAGFAVTITSATVKEGTAIVRVDERRPRSDDLVAQVVTTPFHLVTMPRDIRAFVFERHTP